MIRARFVDPGYAVGFAEGERRSWIVACIFSSMFDILCSLFDSNQSQEKCLYVKRVRALRTWHQKQLQVKYKKTWSSCTAVLIDAKLGRNQLPDLKRLGPENIEIRNILPRDLFRCHFSIDLSGASI